MALMIDRILASLHRLYNRHSGTALAILILSSATFAAPVAACLTHDVRPIQPYNLKYQAKIKGFSVETNRQLKAVREDQFQVNTKAKLMFVAINESSRFETTAQGIRPLEYRYERSGMSNSKDLHLAFSWNQMQATNLLDKQHATINLTQGMQDLLSHQEQLRLDLACLDNDNANQTLTYTIAKKKHVRDYKYRLIGAEQLSTKIGKLQTLKLEKVETKGNRTTTIWLAKDWDYIIARIEHSEDGKAADRMQLIGGKIAGVTISGLDG